MDLLEDECSLVEGIDWFANRPVEDPVPIQGGIDGSEIEGVEDDPLGILWLPWRGVGSLWHAHLWLLLVLG
jgi:hypothetical protein